ncbi:RHS repeat domain-containing protein [Shewanella marina]|uniref:RHS repeat domain-containing protein n=1 Tax=Shewanella marina TaxID=487319 RepID=UPI001900111A|nr:RHS repeat-associated core domain-containing protein [Shewanella marina]
MLSKLIDLSDTNQYRRGFTDHEHFNEQQLIHMNGRVYDYNLGRFMSVDPLIQSPTSTQSVTPYSYIMNNPLAETDPTGYSRIKGRSAANCRVASGFADLPKQTKSKISNDSVKSNGNTSVQPSKNVG